MKYIGPEILLVENDPTDLGLILQTVREAGITSSIEVAMDGEEALDYIFCRGAHADREHIRPQLILLALKLPKVSGLRVLAEIKRNPRMKGIPVVILTSSSEERDVVEGYGMGANSYVQKPLDLSQFQKTIRETLSYWLSVNRPMTTLH